MRNPIHFVAAIRNLVALANVAILAAERFAASLKPEMSRPCFAGTSRPTQPWHQRVHLRELGDRYRQAISESRYADPRYACLDNGRYLGIDNGLGNGQVSTRRCDVQGG